MHCSHLLQSAAPLPGEKGTGEGGGQELSLQKLEPFRNQKNGEGERVLEYEQALNGWDKGIFSLWLYCSKEQVKSGERHRWQVLQD